MVERERYYGRWENACRNTRGVKELGEMLKTDQEEARLEKQVKVP